MRGEGEGILSIGNNETNTFTKQIGHFQGIYDQGSTTMLSSWRISLCEMAGIGALKTAKTVEGPRWSCITSLKQGVNEKGERC